MRFLITESYKKGIVVSVGFNLLAKALSFVTSLALACYFGTSAEMDVYLYSLFTVTIVIGFISSLNSYVIIPESMRLREQEGAEKSVAFLNLFIYGYAAIGALLTLTVLLDPVKIFLAISRFDGARLAANSGILYLSLPLFFLMLISNYLVDILTSRKFFTIPMIVSMGTNLCALLFIICLHDQLGVSSAVAGLVFAYAAQTVFLAGLLKYSLGWDFSFSAVKPGRSVLRNIFFAQLGNLATSLSSYAPLFLLSGLAQGTVSSMNYGRQLSEFPHNLVTLQFSSVAGIKFNELFAKKRGDEVNRVFISSAKILMFALVPVSCLSFAFSTEIITVLFMRGAFNAQSARISADFFRIFVLLLPFYAATTLVGRLFLASQKIRQSFLYQIGVNVLLVAGMVLCVHCFGALGYPASLLILHASNFYFCRCLMRVYFPEVRYGEVLRYFLKLAAVDSLLLYPIVLLAGAVPFPNLFLRLAAASGLYLALILWSASKFRIDRDIYELLQAWKSKVFAGGPKTGEVRSDTRSSPV